MVPKIKASKFMQFFSVIPDPRKLRNQLYSLEDILITSVLAILCGYEDWEDVSLWTEGQLPWLNALGICLHGVPSYDTYNRFYRFFAFKQWVPCARQVDFCRGKVEKKMKEGPCCVMPFLSG
jgi:hypothetical protein